MTKHYNKSSEKQKRRLLRQNQTYLEEILWLHLRNRKCLGIKFRRQYSIDQYVVDFYAPEIKLAIELDGGVHNESDQKAYDAIRQKYIEHFGVTFCRLTNEEYEGNPEKALLKIEVAIKELSLIK
ncbi:MAG: endonuclease domain-containing protein [Ignavibacteriaceae bacterium]|nr:endonuclease domain-containing protein [Ignavibacteriaceae bacterium]